MSIISTKLTSYRVYIEYILIFFIATITFVIMVYNLVYLTKAPPIFIDEPWYADAAWNWLTTGANRDSMHIIQDQIALGTNQWPLIANIPMKLVFKFFGLGLFQARFVSWFFGSLLLLVIFMLGSHIYGKLTGIVAALLLVLSQPFFQASHYARPDVFLAFTVTTSFLLVIYSIKNHIWWASLLAGLIIGLSLDIHLNAILFIIGLLFIYALNYQLKIIKALNTWMFVIGLLIGLIYYLLAHIIPNLNMYQTALSNTHLPPILTLDPKVMLKSIRDEIGRFHFYSNSLDFALIVAGVAYLLFRRSKSDLILLSFIAVVFAGFVLFIGNKHDIYAVLLYPFSMLIVADSFVSLIKKYQFDNKLQIFLTTVLICFVVSSGYSNYRLISENRNYNYYRITEKISSVVPTNATVMGLPHWWLGLANYQYTSSLTLTFLYFDKDLRLDESLEFIKPDYLIVDSGLRGLLVDEGAYATGAGFEFFKLPRNEFDGFLELRGEEILTFSDPWHGEFEIFNINWFD